jgi:DNA polymerase III delta prime subunit
MMATIQGEGRVRQWIISGPPGSGRTSLAVAMGGEASVSPRHDAPNCCHLSERQRVRYLSASRLLQKADQPCESAAVDGQPWSVAEADLVIIDDLSSLLADASGADQVGKWLNRVLGVQGNDKTNVFLRPLCEHEGMMKPDMTEVRLLWVVDDPLLADALETGLRGYWPQLAIERLDLLSRTSA